MKGKEWFISYQDQKEGPFTFEEIKKKRERDEIEDSTLVWSSTLGDWVSFSEVLTKELYQVDDVPMDNEKPENEVIFKQDEVEKKERSSRPWVRFWARMIDYNLFAFFLGLITGIIHPVIMQPQFDIGILSSVVIVFLWAWIEMALLSTWGTTPGKWFLKVKVRRKETGEKLSFREAMDRSLSVWFLGMGAGIFIFAIFTLIVANVKLSNTGLTSWDRRGKFTVSHGKIGFIRTFLTVLFFSAIIILTLAEYRHAL